MMNADEKSIAVAQISKNTLAVHGRKQEQNALLNIPRIGKSSGVSALQDVFKGKPIVVAGAGPSLNQAIPLLKEYAGKYFLIAVDRALKPLLDAGITPHVVTSTDMDVTVAPLFTGYRIPSSIALLYDRDGYWQLPKLWSGPLITYDTFFDVPIWESTFLGFKGTLCKNFTVSHTAFYLAAQMGGSPIILTGVDFAYPNAEDHHVKGAIEIPQEVHEKKVAHWLDIPGNVAPQVHTTEVFSICVVAFESAIKENRVNVVNVSEVGAKMEGARYEPLSKILADHCNMIFDFQWAFDEVLRKDAPSFDPEAFDAQSLHMFESMKALINQCVEGIEILKRLKKIDPTNKIDRPKWNRVYQRVLSIRMEIMDNTYLQYILQRMMVRATNEIEKMLNPILELKAEDPIRLKQECQASAVLFWQEMECAKLFMNALWNVRQELGMDLSQCGHGETEELPEKMTEAPDNRN